MYTCSSTFIPQFFLFIPWLDKNKKVYVLQYISLLNYHYIIIFNDRSQPKFCCFKDMNEPYYKCVELRSAKLKSSVDVTNHCISITVLMKETNLTVLPFI